MKSPCLTLGMIRHGKAESFSSECDDFHRRLVPEGVSAVLSSAKRYSLVPEFRRPDVIFTSPAVRARSTALILADVFGVPHELVFDEPLFYTGTSGADMVSFLRHLNSDFRHVFLAGHFPLIPEALEILTRRGIVSFGTGAMELLVSGAVTWSEAVSAPFERVFHYDPSELHAKGVTI